jgi:hypothetical protein
MGFLLVQEFRKFMYKNAVKILNLKWKGEMDSKLNEEGKGGWYFTAPIAASFYIDQVWKNLIKYPGYRTYCENLCGGYIDRPDPVDNLTIAFESNHECSTEFKSNTMTQALHAVWPLYESKDDMRLEFEAQVYGSEEMHEEIEEKLDEALEVLAGDGKEEVTRS